MYTKMTVNSYLCITYTHNYFAHKWKMTQETKAINTSIRSKTHKARGDSLSPLKNTNRQTHWNSIGLYQKFFYRTIAKSNLEIGHLNLVNVLKSTLFTGFYEFKAFVRTVASPHVHIMYNFTYAHILRRLQTSLPRHYILQECRSVRWRKY